MLKDLWCYLSVTVKNYLPQRRKCTQAASSTVSVCPSEPVEASLLLHDAAAAAAAASACCTSVSSPVLFSPLKPICYTTNAQSTEPATPFTVTASTSSVDNLPFAVSLSTRITSPACSTQSFPSASSAVVSVSSSFRLPLTLPQTSFCFPMLTRPVSLPIDSNQLSLPGIQCLPNSQLLSSLSGASSAQFTISQPSSLPSHSSAVASQTLSVHQTQLYTMSIAQLREICHDLHIASSGNKERLISRLLPYCLSK